MWIALVSPDEGLGGFSYHRISFVGQQHEGVLDYVGLPKDGSWVPFSITGNAVSDKVGDALIEARRYGSSGKLKQTANVTIYSLSPVSMDVLTHGSYKTDLTKATLENEDGPTVYLTAKALLSPVGTPCDTPQLAGLSVGIVQNAVTATSRALYTNPVWDTPVDGDQVTVRSQFQSAVTLIDPADDFPDKQEGPNYGDLAPLCSSGIVSSTDTPGYALVNPNTNQPIVRVTRTNETDKKVLTTVTYTLSSISLNARFLDWCILYNTGMADQSSLQQSTQALVESGWTLDVGTEEKLLTAQADAVQNRTPSEMVLVKGANNNAMVRSGVLSH